MHRIPDKDKREENLGQWGGRGPRTAELGTRLGTQTRLQGPGGLAQFVQTVRCLE